MNTKSRVNILVVEDEILLAEDIKLRLTKLGYHVSGLAASVEEAEKLLSNIVDIDLVIIDIVLKGERDGIDLAEIINAKFKKPFIFLTSHADRALVDRAKKQHPYAYMLKPFTDREISINMEMALANFSDNKTDDGVDRRSEGFAKDDNRVLKINDSLFLKKDNHFERVNLNSISLLEANNNYTTIYTESDKFIYSTVLKKMEEKLPSAGFLRVHRSYVINVNSVSGFEGNMLFIGEKKIPVSKQYRDLVFNLFNSL